MILGVIIKNDRFKIRKIYFIQLNKYKVVEINFLSLFLSFFNFPVYVNIRRLNI